MSEAQQQPQQQLLPLDAFRKFDQEREKARNAAKEQAVKKGEEAVATLSELGFHYVFAPEQKGHGPREVKDAPCSVCGFKTLPLHDARSHRGQEPKKTFSAEELKTRGLSKAP